MIKEFNMWVKSQTGSYFNLANATELRVTEQSTGWYVTATIIDDEIQADLARFKNAGDAKVALAQLMSCLGTVADW